MPPADNIKIRIHVTVSLSLIPVIEYAYMLICHKKMRLIRQTVQLNNKYLFFKTRYNFIFIV
jgi:hypothetical protein